MKTFKIISPAYRANGLNGTYLSIAVCENDGTIQQIVGDHASLANTYSNVHELVGKSFTDSDRFISIKEVNCDVELLNNYVAARTQQAIEEKEWEAKHNEFTGGNAYDFCHAKKAPKGNLEKYNAWKSENPYPSAKAEYYSFLNTIIEKVIIKHNTKGYFQEPNNWICSEQNAAQWATKYTIEQAEEKAKTLTAIDGKLLKQLHLVRIGNAEPEFGFRSLRLVKTITNA